MYVPIFIYGKFIGFDPSPFSNAVATMAVVFFFLLASFENSFYLEEMIPFNSIVGVTWWHWDQPESWGLATAVGALESLKWGVKMFQDSKAPFGIVADEKRGMLHNMMLPGGSWLGTYILVISTGISFDLIPRNPVWPYSLDPHRRCLGFGWCFLECLV